MKRNVLKLVRKITLPLLGVVAGVFLKISYILARDINMPMPYAPFPVTEEGPLSRPQDFLCKDSDGMCFLFFHLLERFKWLLGVIIVLLLIILYKILKFVTKINKQQKIKNTPSVENKITDSNIKND